MDFRAVGGRYLSIFLLIRVGIKKFLKKEVLTPQIDLKDAIEKSHRAEVLTKEIEALKKKIDREKQFKKRERRA